MIGETKLTRWAAAPSPTEAEQSERAIRAVRKAINNSPALKNRTIKTFVQGSYRNRVNVSRESDVDVGVLCSDTFHFKDRNNLGREMLGLSSPATYGYSSFKNELEQALRAHFPANTVTRGNKAFSVNSNTVRVQADVVPFFEYRDYFGNANYRGGVILIPDKGPNIHNYPERLLDWWPQIPLHYENGVSKNAATSRSFKGITRILKSIRREMKSTRLYFSDVPSYLCECLAYQTPNAFFHGFSWSQKLEQVLGYLESNLASSKDVSDWTEVDGVKYLFHVSQPWTQEKALKFVSSCRAFYTNEQ